MTLIPVIQSPGDRIGWEGTAGHGWVGAPAPLAPSWRWVLRPWADRERGRKELAQKGLRCRSEVAPGELRVREKPPGKLRCKGHFLASTRPVPSEAGFSGSALSGALSWLPGEGAGGLLSPDSGAQDLPPFLPHKHSFLVGAQSRCSLLRELSFRREKGKVPAFCLGRDISF